MKGKVAKRKLAGAGNDCLQACMSYLRMHFSIEEFGALALT
jgi:hypothetical protein